MNLSAPSYIEQIAPYVGGKPIEELAREMGLDPHSIVKLASNENPLGMPDSAKTAIKNAMNDLGRYPDGNAFEVKAAISQKVKVPTDWITLGNGSNDILVLAAQAFVEKGQSIVFSQYSFVVYALATQAIGARSIVVPAIELGHDLNAMLAAIEPDTRMIFIANPNNPTGTFLTPDEIAGFLAKVPNHIVVVLDEAYNEYLDASLRFDASLWVKQYPNLIVSRTLSKAYGLAGLRVGYALAQSKLTDLLNRVRQPFNVNSLAQAAAVAAIQDDAFLEKSKAVNAAGYAQLCQAFDAMGLCYVPSKANFVLLHIGARGQGAVQVNQKLLQQGVIVRPVANYGLADYLRISIGLEAENAAFIQALQKALAP